MADLSFFDMLKDLGDHLSGEGDYAPDFNEANPPKPWGMESPGNNVALAVLQKDLDQRAAAQRVVNKGGASLTDYAQTAGGVGRLMMDEAVQSLGAAVALPKEVAEGKVDPLSAEGVDRTAALAGFAGGGATTFGRYPVGSLGVFGSRLHPDSSLYKRFESDMSKVNYDIDKAGAQQVLADTGLSKDINGNWVLETDDSQAKVMPGVQSRLNTYDPVNRTGGAYGLPLDQVIDHPELFEAFPYLRSIAVKESTEKDATGSYRHYGNGAGELTVDFKQSPEEIKKTLLHEIQHAVNAHETDAGVKRPLGESTDDSIWDRVSKAYDIYEHMRDAGKLSVKEDASLQDMFRKLQTKFQTYQRNPGEVEARNVEDRMHLSAEARREVLPVSTETIPRSEQLDLHEVEEIHHKLFRGD